MGLRAERFLENGVEPARNALEREGERYLHVHVFGGFKVFLHTKSEQKK